MAPTSPSPPITHETCIASEKYILWDTEKYILWDTKKYILCDTAKYKLWDAEKYTPKNHIKVSEKCIHDTQSPPITHETCSTLLLVFCVFVFLNFVLVFLYVS